MSNSVKLESKSFNELFIEHNYTERSDNGFSLVLLGDCN